MNGVEQLLADHFNMPVQKLRVLLHIATGLTVKMQAALKGTPVEDDVDGLMVLTRLEPEVQDLAAKLIGRLMTAEEVVHLAALGELEPILEYCDLARWIDE